VSLEYCTDDLKTREVSDENGVFKGSLDKNGTRTGLGTYYWNDGAVYEGFWKEDHADGQGRLITVEGDVYEGSFTNDMANGLGKYTHANG
jgi:hypothetical protein